MHLSFGAIGLGLGQGLEILLTFSRTHIVEIKSTGSSHSLMLFLKYTYRLP